jgi:hypothetical protein
MASRMRFISLDRERHQRWKDYFESYEWSTGAARQDTSRPQRDYFHYVVSYKGKSVAWQSGDDLALLGLPAETSSMLTDMTGET